MAKRKVNNYGTGIPDFELASLARLLLPDIRAFFASETGKREFEDWQAERNKKHFEGVKHNESVI